MFRPCNLRWRNLRQRNTLVKSPMVSPSRPRLPRAERRLQLLEVARAVFAARGYDGASLELIAEAAGVSRPIVYSHFGDKQGLFEAVVGGEIARVREVVTAALAAPGRPQEILERGLRSFFGYVREHPEGHAVLTRDAPLHLSGAGMSVMIDGLANRITEVIAGAARGAGLDAGPAPIYANALIGLGVHVGRWWREHPEVSLDDVTRHTTALLWSGFSGIMADPDTALRRPR